MGGAARIAYNYGIFWILIGSIGCGSTLGRKEYRSLRSANGVTKSPAQNAAIASTPSSEIPSASSAGVKQSGDLSKGVEEDASQIASLATDEGCVDTPPGSPGFRGFPALEYLGISKDEVTRDVIKSIETQIDYVCAVGLPEEILKFMKSVPITLVPPLQGGSPALYSSSRLDVEISPQIVYFDQQAVLIHELLHAYHHQKISGSFNNPELLSFFNSAQGLPAYSSRSHMMNNHAEFFACSAATYLFGTSFQEPFTREKIQQSQEDFYSYLVDLFGPSAGKYDAGALPN